MVHLDDLDAELLGGPRRVILTRTSCHVGNSLYLLIDVGSGLTMVLGHSCQRRTVQRVHGPDLVNRITLKFINVLTRFSELLSSLL